MANADRMKEQNLSMRRVRGHGPRRTSSDRSVGSTMGTLEMAEEPGSTTRKATLSVSAMVSGVSGIVFKSGRTRSQQDRGSANGEINPAVVNLA